MYDRETKRQLIANLPITLKFKLLHTFGAKFIKTISEKTIDNASPEEYEFIKEKLTSNPFLLDELLKHLPDSEFLLKIKNSK